jgi:hypothetical protein
VRDWETLHTKYPGDFTSSTEELFAWHLQEVQKCEIAGKWSDAVVHLNRLVQQQSARWDLFARRGRAFAEQGQWRQAAADYFQARVLSAPPALTWLEREAHDCEVVGHWSTAVFYLDQLIEARPADPVLRVRRGQASERRGLSPPATPPG